MGNNATSGEDAYRIKLDQSNLIASGNYADVYKVLKRDSEVFYAAKFIKIPLNFFSIKDQLGFDRELEILKEINHPFVIKY
jgi:serine/threonine protein kinase